MALTNTKRKLDETSHSNGSYNQPRKRRHSHHESLSSISNQTAKQPANRHMHAVNKATKAKQAYDNTSDSSTDDVSAAKPSKAGTRKAIDKKQKASGFESTSLDDSDISTAEPIEVDTNVTSNVPLLVPSNPSSADAVSEEEGAGIEEDDDDEQEIEYTDSDNPPTSTSSPDPPSNASTTPATTDPPPTTKLKADNPTAFATSISHILNSKLTTTQRSNPILARSLTAKTASTTLLDQRLEKKAKAEMKKKKQKIEKGAEDPLLVGSEEVVREKELRKMAQRGVVKMFNAFNAVREKAAEAKAKGVELGGGSRAKREERATEMSKEGWLEFVGRGGKGEV